MFFDKSLLTSWIFAEASGTAGSEVMVPVGWYRPILNTPLRSLSLFSFSFSRAFRSFQRLSCFSLSSTAFAVEEQASANQLKLEQSIFLNCESIPLAGFSLFFIFSCMVDILATAIEAFREDISSSGSLSSCLRVFTVRSRFSFWEWDLLRDIFTLSIDTLVSRCRRWANRDSIIRYLDFSRRETMFWKVLQIACNGYYRHYETFVILDKNERDQKLNGKIFSFFVL